ncbi:MAG: hypothetical protein MUO72_00800 [Bacteroidales bacterium]|nr:hypothetical protein [Bacteroidales bacterium]
MNIGFSQEKKSEINPIGIKKNVIYGTLGVYIEESYGTLLGNYERMVFQLPNSFVQSFWLRIGAGPWAWWTADGMNYVSTLSVLMGRRSAHLEIGSGVLFTYDSDEKRFHPLVNDSHLAGNLGFRFQKPGGLLVFRTGIGWPEFMYLSLGICF